MSPRERYRDRVDGFMREAEVLGERSRRLGSVRLVTFLSGSGALVVWAIGSPPLPRAWMVGGLLLLVLFGGLVAAHIRVDRLKRWKESFAILNSEGLARLDRAWSALPMEDEAAPLHHPYAADLDILGHASLRQLLSTVTSAPGREMMNHWLLNSAPPDEVVLRQRAVAELAPMLDLRDKLAAHGRRVGFVDPAVVRRFLTWAVSDPWLASRAGLRWTTRILPAISLGLIALHILGIVEWAWILPTGIALAVVGRTTVTVGGLFAAASSGESGFRRYGSLFEVLEYTTFQADALVHIQKRLSADGKRAHEQMARLRKLLDSADSRLSMVHFVFNVLWLWDLKVLAGLEAWKAHCGAHVEDWLEALGEAEALAALATLAHDNPRWTFPELTADDILEVHARDLGHPLIHPRQCVTNDVQIGPPGSFLLVTGSNMSGKSTLLRAIGVNVVLAQAGGPVHASSLTLPTVALETSMRVQDSLEEGLSHFMAELQRLKGVVDAARFREEDEPVVLYLLDEILQGTNTVERQIAARSVIAHLLEVGALGAVTTHDLGLADTEELSCRSVPVHFTESFLDTEEGTSLTFDYTLRPGLARSTNALHLMRMVGLEVDGEETQSRPDGAETRSRPSGAGKPEEGSLKSVEDVGL